MRKKADVLQDLGHALTRIPAAALRRAPKDGGAAAEEAVGRVGEVVRGRRRRGSVGGQGRRPGREAAVAAVSCISAGPIGGVQALAQSILNNVLNVVSQ